MKSMHPTKKKIAPHNRLSHTFDSKVIPTNSAISQSLKYPMKPNLKSYKFNPNTFLNKKVYNYHLSYKTKTGKLDLSFKKRPPLLSTGLKLFRKKPNSKLSNNSAIELNNENEFNSNFENSQIPLLFHGLPSLHIPLKTGAPKGSKWIHQEFIPRSRNDGLRLRHWKRVDIPENGNEAFANLNILSYAPEFSEEEYNLVLEDPNWNFENSQLLCQLIRQFSHNFIIIGSEFRKRNIHIRDVDAKYRYYDIINKLSEFGKLIPENEQQLARQYFDKKFYDQENSCNKLLNKWYQRSRQEVEEETLLALQTSHIIHNYVPPSVTKPQLDHHGYGALDVLSGPSTTNIKKTIPHSDSIKSSKTIVTYNDKIGAETQVPLEVPPHKPYQPKKDNPPVGFFLRSGRIPKVKASCVESIQSHMASMDILWYPSMPTSSICPIVEEFQDTMVEYLELKQTKEKLEAELRSLKSNNTTLPEPDSSIEVSNSTYNNSRNIDRNSTNSSVDSIPPHKRKKRKE